MFNFNRKVDAFSLSLANSFINDFPLEQNVKPHSSKKYQKRLNKALRNIDTKINDFKSSNKISIYKKARIGNKFMWSLKEHDYDNQLVEEITKQLLIKLN